MAKDIKLYKDGQEVTINETQLDNFIALGYKEVGQQEEVAKPKITIKQKEKDNKEK